MNLTRRGPRLWWAAALPLVVGPLLVISSCKDRPAVAPPGEEKGAPYFQDVTKEVGLDKIDFYTHGVAVADYNNDGWPDLLVTGWGRVALFRNDPVDAKDPSKGRKFTDVTKEAGLTDDQWSTSAGFADF